MPPAKFSPGDLVQRTNQPEAIGVVRSAHWDEQVESWNYSVQFGSRLVAVPEEVIRPLQVVESPWDALAQGSYSGVNHFVFTLTYHRLQSPPARVAYAFSTARTQFYPHQFKPLLKLLDNEGRGLLIADDVGLGKTIEAGYILREMQARRGIERVLIMVPARLTPKWKKEMRLRFDEHFDVVKGTDLLRLAERLRHGQEPEEFRWIVSYESARPEEVRRALEETQPPIDLFVADEAHRMRNSESLQHRVGATISRCSDTTVFLTATPVQNRLEDLWNLLRLISPEEFPAWELFECQVNANKLVLAAQHALSERPPDLRAAASRLEEFAKVGGRSMSQSFYESITGRLAEVGADRRELVELQADVSKLSPLAHLVSRTRKAEAMPDRAQRSAMWHPVRLAPAEREVYDSVAELCRMSWPGAGTSWGFRMSLMMAYRATASSIPAAMRYFAERLREANILAEFNGQFEEDVDVEEAEYPAEGSAWTGPSRSYLKEIVERWQSSGGVDTKLEELVDAISNLWAEDATEGRRRRKIVLFSYFRRTLEYLRNALATRDIGVRMIHGGVGVEERGVAIDEFLEREDVPVLLTSEVGGEGIDLQKASVLFNYDLPWNPMVVEQRIGRLDRIGQQAKRIVIVNFVVSGSIEEYVLQRLLDKISIFRESVGEIDPILGEEIESLTQKALSGELSPEELELAVEQKGNALENRVVQARQMLSRVNSLLASDQSIVDEINALTGERQIPSEKDLLLFLNTCLARRFPGRQLPTQAAAAVVSVNLRGDLAMQLEIAAAELGADAAAFGRRAAGGPVDLTLSREAGYHHPRAELIHLRHPLVRYAIREAGEKNTPTAFSVALKDAPDLNPGVYGFLVALVEMKDGQSATRLAAIFADAHGEGVWDDQDVTTPVVLAMLERGRDVEVGETLKDRAEHVKGRLLSALDKVKADWNRREERAAAVRREQRRAVVRRALELKLEKARLRVETLRQRDAPPFPLRMAQAQLEKASREYEAASAAHEDAAPVGIGTVVEAAVGFLTVG